MINDAINNVAWPESVQKLKFRGRFNRAIIDAVWLDWRCLISTRLGLFRPGLVPLRKVMLGSLT